MTVPLIERLFKDARVLAGSLLGALALGLAWGCTASSPGLRGTSDVVESTVAVPLPPPRIFEIAGSRYAIPAGYVVESTGLILLESGARLYASWPGLEPRGGSLTWYTERGERPFAKPRRLGDLDSVIFIRLHGAPQRGILPMNGPWHDGRRAAAIGLRQYVPGLSDRNAIYFSPANPAYQTHIGWPVVFRCEAGGPGLTGAIEVDPRCDAEYRLAEGTWLSYAFHPSHIADWRDIDSGILDLVKSFRK